MTDFVRRVAGFAPVLLLAAGCARPAEPAGANPAARGPEVTVVRPQKAALKKVVEQPGTVQAFEETHLFAKLSGYVRVVNADIGQRVRGPKSDSSGSVTDLGDVLAEIAIPELVEEARQKEALVRQGAAEVEQARKALLASEAAVASAESQVAEAKAGLGRAQANFERWESESVRVAGLVRGGVIDAQTRDETTNQFRSAQAARDEAKARVESAEAAVRKARADRDKAAADVTADEARLDVCKADARRTEAMLGYTKIRAPFDGVVTARRVSTGDFLADGGGKQGVFTVARIDPVRVVVHVPEADAGVVREGLPIAVRVQALGGPDLAGTVTRTSWSLEPGSRTLRTEADVPNHDGRLRPGMYAYARITVPFPEAWTVPAAALARPGDAWVCYRVVDGKAARTPVQLGRGDGQRVEVRRWQKAPDEWADFTGAESLAAPAAALADGQAVP